MSQPPPASGDRARSRPAPSPVNPIAPPVQDVRVERDGSKACRLRPPDPDVGVWAAGGIRLDGNPAVHARIETPTAALPIGNRLMPNPILDERGTSNRIADALDFTRLDEIARLAALATSYWRSVELAAERGDALTLVVHCKQLAAVTREAFAIVKTLGETDVAA